MLRVLVAGLALAVVPTVADACVTQVQTAPAPITKGHLAYEAVLETYRSNLYYYDFLTKTRTLVDASPDLNPLNPSIAPDGSWIVFTGRIAYQGIRHLYAWSPGLEQPPVDLTPAATVNEEDPKISFDGKHLVFKDNGRAAIARLSMATGTISIGKIHDIIGGDRGTSQEASKPVLSRKNDYLYFWQSSNTNPDDTNPNDPAPEQLARIDFVHGSFAISGSPLLIANPPHRVRYYPNPRQDGVMFFVDAAAGTDDEVFISQADDPALTTAASSPANFCSGSNSDPVRATNRRYIFSSTQAGTGYKLYLADFQTEVYSFDARDPQINAPTGDLLGADYIAF